MRITRTGTGRGTVMGRAHIDYCASRDRTVDSCSVHWDGESRWAPLLWALAFDEYLPNLRSIEHDGHTVFAKEAQQQTLAEFEAWLRDAEDEARRGDPLPLFQDLPVTERPSGEQVARSTLTVRLNADKQRLWAETDHAPKDAGGLFFSLLYKILWDWIAATKPGPEEAAQLLKRVRRQCEYYRTNGIPSDFLLRGIGKAPFSAWRDAPEVPLSAAPSA